MARTSLARSDCMRLAEVSTLRGSIVRRSVRDVIGDKIAMLIAAGILQVGDMLPGERDLASALNVSRESVRGAIQLLAARGILEIAQGARTRVVRAEVGAVPINSAATRAVDDYDLETVHASRMFVERQLVADAARLIDATAIETLEALLAAQKAAIDDPVRFLISDREFHLALYRAGGNPLLADFASDLYAYMMTYRRQAVARPGAIATSIGDHAAIVNALRARNREAAMAALARHSERIHSTTRSLLGDPHH